MSWECPVPSMIRPEPRAVVVRLRFVEESRTGLDVVNTALCDHLKARGERVVAVDFRIWGNSLDGLVGFTHWTIDGKSFFDQDRGGGTFSEGMATNPLARSFESEALRSVPP